VRTWYANATLHTGRDVLEETGLVVENGRVAEVTAGMPTAFDERVNLAGALLAPGFIDLQVNGGGGVMFNDDPSPEGLARIAAAHRACGTTAFLPTFVTGPLGGMRAARAAVGACTLDAVLGVHFEGPFLDEEMRGAHPAAFLRAPADAEQEVIAGGTGVTLLTLSARHATRAFVRAMRAAGVHLSLGHTAATHAEACAAFDAGVGMVTHLYNAMTPLASRAPGVVGATLLRGDVTAGIIVDGIHVDPRAVEVAYRMKRPGGLILVTDAISVVGSDAREVELGGQRVTVRDGRCVNEEGHLAGSALDMASAVRNAVRACGIPLDDALRMASTWPARALGLAGRGVLEPGARADFVVLDPESLAVRATAIGGLIGG
jgi:N-acetylglucosamine-6-phosphate deacetylase